MVRTIIGQGTKFVGDVNINYDSDIEIRGTFEGSIVSASDVIVEDGGVLKGTVQCRTLKVAPGGYYSGELEAKNFNIVPGAIIDGKLKIVK